MGAATQKGPGLGSSSSSSSSSKAIRRVRTSAGADRRSFDTVVLCE